MKITKLAHALLLSMALATAGCVSTGSTHVSRGEQYQPGLIAYDEFFKLLHELQIEVHGVDDDRRAARSGLTQAVGLLPDAPTDRILDLLRQKVTEARSKGASFVVQGDSIKATGSAEAQTLATQAGQCVVGERKIAESMKQVAPRASSLGAMANTLVGTVDRDFTMLRAKEVRRELDDARYVLTRMRDASPRISAASQKLSDDVVAIFAAGGSAAKPPPASTAKPPPASTAKPPAQPPPTAAPPKPPPKGPDDFNP